MKMHDRRPTIAEQLRLAIADKRLIEVSYHGRTRVAEPHDYGIKNGVEKLLVYQLRAVGAHDRKPVTGWRLLEVSQIDSCVVLDEPFPGSRGSSSQRHMTWEQVFARVT